MGVKNSPHRTGRFDTERTAASGAESISVLQNEDYRGNLS